MRVIDLGFDSVGVRLQGTVWSPDEPVQMPAVLLVGGSGRTDRTNGGYFIPLRDALVAAGITVLGYDKRGAGASTGDWAAATVDDLAADATAAMQVLSAQPGVDPQRVGLFGHSEGGWVALRACSSYRCSFLILNGCPAVPFLDAEIYALARAGVDSRHARDLYENLRSTARAGADVRMANRLLAEIEDAQLRAVLDDADFTLDRERWAQLRSWIDYTPDLDLQRLTVPTLAVYGADDPLTPIQASLSVLAHVAPSVRVQLFAGADHRIHLDGELAPGYLKAIAAWGTDTRREPITRQSDPNS